VLFAASLAVYVTVVVPSGNVAPEEKLDVRFTQLVTVGAVQVTTFEHSDASNETLIVEGQPEITGAVMSVTTTLNEHVDILFAASVAVYVTIVVPRGNAEPEAKLEVSVTQPGTVGAVQVTTFEHSDASSDVLMLEGQPEITGGVTSVTTTLNEQVDVLFAASVAVYVTVVVPNGKLEPEGKFAVRFTQLATVGAVQVTTFEHSLASNDALMFVGQLEMTGAVLSVTTTLNEHVEVLFAASVAV
jgi:hypothetical protein